MAARARADTTQAGREHYALLCASRICPLIAARNSCGCTVVSTVTNFLSPVYPFDNIMMGARALT
jgi:hypothetical protein